MSSYVVKLTDGTTFIGERPWYFDPIAWTSIVTFRNIQGREAPAMNPKDKLHVPRTSIIYIVEQRG